MPDPIDHTLTTYPVCPYCGHNHAGSWEGFESGVYECEECEKEFNVEVVVEVNFTTSKIEEGK